MSPVAVDLRPQAGSLYDRLTKRLPTGLDPAGPVRETLQEHRGAVGGSG